MNDSVLFIMTGIDSTQFCRELRRYWAKLNDCAITYNPSDETVYLLETLPGKKSRSLPDSFGNESVHKYFQSVIRTQTDAGREVNLIRNLFAHQYDNFSKHPIYYIDPSDLAISEIDLLGKGSYGRVYKANCKNLPSDTADFEDAREGSVAVKIAYEVSSVEDRNSAKFFQKFRLLNLALLGSSIGFVEFFGFTPVQVDEAGRLCLEGAEGKAVLALVFDFADEGSALKFLDGHLEQENFQKNWLIVCGGMNSLSLGLSSIHSQDVLHRDIHPNNVLVKAQDSGEDNYYNFLLADIGEGKTVLNTAETLGGIAHSGNKIVNLNAYRAPEIPKSGFSKATDIYAYARTCFDMIRFDSYCLSMEMDGEKKLLIPTKLLGILRTCTSSEPDNRLQARHISIMLDEVEKDIRRNQAVWFEGYEFETTPASEGALSTDFSLPSSLESL